MHALGKYKSTMRTKVHGRKTLKLHRLIVEGLTGIRLNSDYEVHHVDGNRANNTPSNLVLCPNKTYHQLLHRRQEVQDAGYNPNTHHKCTDCEKFKLFSEFSLNKTRASGYSNVCKTCMHTRQRKIYLNLKEKQS